METGRRGKNVKKEGKTIIREEGGGKGKREGRREKCFKKFYKYNERQTVEQKSVLQCLFPLLFENRASDSLNQQKVLSMCHA